MNLSYLKGIRFPKMPKGITVLGHSWSWEDIGDFIGFVWVGFLLLVCIIFKPYITIPILVIAFLFFKYITSESFTTYCTQTIPRMEGNLNRFIAYITFEAKDKRLDKIIYCWKHDMWWGDRPWEVKCDNRTKSLAYSFMAREDNFDSTCFNPEFCYKRLIAFLDEYGYFEEDTTSD